MTQIFVTQQSAQLIIGENNNTVTVNPKYSSVVEVVAMGPQGPPGAAAYAYVHSQSSPSTTWTINHNLGYIPCVELFDSGSQEIEATVTHPSINQAVILLTVPSAGFARLI